MTRGLRGLLIFTVMGGVSPVLAQQGATAPPGVPAPDPTPAGGAPDRPVSKAQVAAQNKQLDKAETRLRKELGPAIVSITRKFCDPELIVEIDERALPTKSGSTSGKRLRSLVAGTAEASEPKIPTYTPPPQTPSQQMMSAPNPPSPPSTIDRVRESLPNPSRYDVTPMHNGGVSGSAPGTHIFGIKGKT